MIDILHHQLINEKMLNEFKVEVLMSSISRYEFLYVYNLFYFITSLVKISLSSHRPEVTDWSIAV